MLVACRLAVYPRLSGTMWAPTLARNPACARAFGAPLLCLRGLASGRADTASTSKDRRACDERDNERACIRSRFGAPLAASAKAQDRRSG
jgi:hypothetical protein